MAIKRITRNSINYSQLTVSLKGQSLKVVATAIPTCSLRQLVESDMLRAIGAREDIVDAKGGIRKHAVEIDRARQDTRPDACHDDERKPPGRSEGEEAGSHNDDNKGLLNGYFSSHGHLVEQCATYIATERSAHGDRVSAWHTIGWQKEL